MKFRRNSWCFPTRINGPIIWPNQGHFADDVGGLKRQNIAQNWQEMALAVVIGPHSSENKTGMKL